MTLHQKNTCLQNKKNQPRLNKLCDTVTPMQIFEENVSVKSLTDDDGWGGGEEGVFTVNGEGATIISCPQERLINVSLLDADLVAPGGRSEICLFRRLLVGRHRSRLFHTRTRHPVRWHPSPQERACGGCVPPGPQAGGGGGGQVTGGRSMGEGRRMCRGRSPAFLPRKGVCEGVCLCV